MPLDELETEMMKNLEARLRKRPASSQIRKRPASSQLSPSAFLEGRPKRSIEGKPMPYKKGVIYMHQNKSRAYHARDDRIESSFTFKPDDKLSIDKAWERACAAIEDDTRNNGP